MEAELCVSRFILIRMNEREGHIIVIVKRYKGACIVIKEGV